MLVFIALTLALGAVLAAWFMWRQSAAEEERSFIPDLDSDEYNVNVHTPEKEAYLELLEEEQAGKTTPNQMVVGLLNRAIALVPVIERVEHDRPRMHRVHKHSYIPTSALEDMTAVEHELSAEVEEVRAEAERLREGWGRQIFAQAFHIVRKKRMENRPTGRWAQTQQDLKLGLPLPGDVTVDAIAVKFEREACTVTMGERKPIEFRLEAPIKPEECSWAVVEQNHLEITFIKETPAMWEAPAKR